MFKCPYCSEKEYPKIDSLRIHCSKSHKISSKQMYVDVVLCGIEPKCKCGCSGEVKFLDTGRGFSEYIRGHAARVPGKNNWANNEKAVEKSLKKRKEMIETGEHKPFLIKETGKYWMQGSTKETDQRLKQMSETIKNNENEINIRSRRMKTNRLNGTIMPPQGDKHPQWKGGISKLYAYCHGNNLLYKKWKYPILKKSEFSCEKCGESRKNNFSLILHVHHNDIKMNTIMKIIMNNNNYKEELHSSDSFIKNKIANEVAQYHVDNNIIGIVLCYSCHKKEHPKLNFKT